MNAIVNECRPWASQGVNSPCGGYFVDLSSNNAQQIVRSAIELQVNSSCSYRGVSTCGYPEVSIKVLDPRIVQDFDIAYSYEDGLSPVNELDGWNFNLNTSKQTSFASTNVVHNISLGHGQRKIND